NSAGGRGGGVLRAALGREFHEAIRARVRAAAAGVRADVPADGHLLGAGWVAGVHRAGAGDLYLHAAEPAPGVRPLQHTLRFGMADGAGGAGGARAPVAVGAAYIPADARDDRGD